MNLKRIGLNILACLIAFFSLYYFMQITYKIKKETTNNIYKTSQISLRATEIKQYINNLEFGISYGKNLESYYNMDDTLQEMMLLSSYIEGIYIISTDDEVLYTVGEDISQLNDIYVYHSGDDLFKAVDYNNYTLMYMDMLDGDNKLAGTMMVMLNSAFMENFLDEYQKQSRLQSIIIAGEAACLFLIIFIRFSSKKIKKLTLFKVILLICCMVLLAQCIDVGVELIKLNTKVNIITNQSVQKITQVLQQQVDTVIGRGVAKDEIYNIHGWLQEINDKLDSVKDLDFTAHGKIRAEMNDSYVYNTVINALLNMGSLLVYIFAGSLVLSIIGFFISRKIERQNYNIIPGEAKLDAAAK